mmetsp:Transcript_33869/g.83253  ORF Transcript_33869/g.83253 Transcript_33869/m.83253 type:complete len:200 (-) Transcript_33869:1330-1929(-)
MRRNHDAGLSPSLTPPNNGPSQETIQGRTGSNIKISVPHTFPFQGQRHINNSPRQLRPRWGCTLPRTRTHKMQAPPNKPAHPPHNTKMRTHTSHTQQKNIDPGLAPKTPRRGSTYRPGQQNRLKTTKNTRAEEKGQCHCHSRPAFHVEENHAGLLTRPLVTTRMAVVAAPSRKSQKCAPTERRPAGRKFCRSSGRGPSS